jgi:hypothetical protein
VRWCAASVCSKVSTYSPYKKAATWNCKKEPFHRCDYVRCPNCSKLSEAELPARRLTRKASPDKNETLAGSLISNTRKASVAIVLVRLC